MDAATISPRQPTGILTAIGAVAAFLAGVGLAYASHGSGLGVVAFAFGLVGYARLSVRAVRAFAPDGKMCMTLRKTERFVGDACVAPTTISRQQSALNFLGTARIDGDSTDPQFRLSA